MPPLNVILASQSPRRKQLLEEADVEVSVIKPPYDDPADPSEVNLSLGEQGGSESAQTILDLAGQFACLLAERKLHSCMHLIKGHVRETGAAAMVIAADTVCVDQLHDKVQTPAWQQALIGKPESPEAAFDMLRHFSDRSHAVVTGVGMGVFSIQNPDHSPGALLPVQCEMQSFWDAAMVHLGKLDDSSINAYLDTDEWRGKAGAYNLRDRMQAGWPLSIDPKDDPSTVMGLPMLKLKRWLDAFELTRQMMAASHLSSGFGAL